MEGLIDLSIALPALVDGASFRLSSSIPPHSIVEWRGPGRQPSDLDILNYWSTYTPPVVRSLSERVAAIEADISEIKR